MPRRRRAPSSIVFLHIPKTGGTSVTRSLSRHYPEAACYTDQGNLTAALLTTERQALAHGCFFHGHPFHDTLKMTGPARLATVLREPESHAISNYLYLQREPGLPLHAASMALDFPDFLRVHWQVIVFQAISLDVGQSAGPLATPELFFQRLPGIHALLRRIDFVGCLERIDAFMAVIAAAQGWPAMESVPALNTAPPAGVAADRVEHMRRQYRHLRQDFRVAPLLHAEAAVYRRARNLAERQSAASGRGRGLRHLRHVLQPDSLAPVHG